MNSVKTELTNSLKQQAEIKEKGSMRQSDMVNIMASDDELVAGRIRNSSKSIESASDRFNKASDVLLSANSNLMKQCIDIESKSKKACAGVKSSVNNIRDQLVKIDSILGDNVEHKIAQLERVAAALKTISELSGDDKTMSIVSAMVSKS